MYRKIDKLSFLIYLCLFQTLPIHSIRTEKCSPKKEIIEKLEKQHGVRISELNHNITFDYDENIFITNGQVGVTHIYLNNVGVNYKQGIAARGINNPINGYFTAEQIVIRRSEQTNNSIDEDMYHCQMIDWDSSQLKTNSSKLELIIQKLTKSCIEDIICNQYDEIIVHVFLRKEKKRTISHSSIKNHTALRVRSSIDPAVSYSDEKNPTFCSTLSYENNYNPQSTINVLFDFAVSAGMTIFAGIEDGVLRIPYIEKDYEFAGATGEFQAYGGTFMDLRALYRVKDIVFSHDKNRFMVAASFRLEKAKLSFPYYKLRYGIIKIKGHMEVDIEGITVSVKLAADYNASPCQVHLVDLNMDELGKTTVNFTGLGWPLNGAVKLAIQYIVEHKVFPVIKDVAVESVQGINCEKFRPSSGVFSDKTEYRNVIFRKINN